MKRIPVLLFLAVMLNGCSSTPPKTEFAADRVVGRVDGLTQRPEWVKETVSIFDKGELLQVVGVVEVPGDSRAQAAFKASDAAARGHLANKIETQLIKIVESQETGFSMEDQSLSSLIREVSQVKFNDLDVKDRYWEKVARTGSSGEETLVMKAFSLLSIPKPSVKRMIASSIEKQNKAPRDLRNKVENVVRSNWNTDDLDSEE